MNTPRISAFVAIGDNRVIGKGNGLLWRMPNDLPRFKELTMGHPVVMGRKTFESILEILGKPLPGRTNIVITRDSSWSYPDAVVVHSVTDALARAAEIETEEVFIIGGGQIYTEALPYTDRLYLTRIHDAKEGDTFFPAYEDEFTKELSRESHEADGIRYDWVTLERPSSTKDLS